MRPKCPYCITRTIMTTAIPTIAVFPEEKLTLDQKIEKWVWQLCRSLEQNYQGKYPNSSAPIKFRMEFGRKYIKVWSYLVSGGERLNGNSCWMFVDKNTGECYKPASYKAPAKGVRYLITQLADNPHACDPYGSFLYL